MTLKDISLKILAHLRRFENDPAINTTHPANQRPRYFQTNCFSSGKRVVVRYIGFQTGFALWKEEALRYLAWLDAGNVGKHFEMPKENQ